MLLTLERKHLKVGIRGRMIHSKRASVTVLADSSFLWQGRNFEHERSHNKNYEQNKLYGACRISSFQGY